ncbi:hypothetical protein PVMG_06071 [Plasmodium vivax Mauritania I]|uniref:Uncharacterized protein n=1 Tax=Plasmodium vivax Mauritania I TaxID=1035515 RepID=A0A0J9T3D6_PLAVI|nr:hypothetical protein PVMG_06071 [Plasmodium vivax Mauritania I]
MYNLFKHLIKFIKDQFPDFASKIPESQDVSDSEIKTQCEAFRDSKLTTYVDKSQFVNKCINFVNYFNTIKENVLSKPAFCEYINYWLYDTLKDKVSSSSSELLNEFYRKITKLNDCKNYKKYINEEIYNELNELYKLYEHLIKYKNVSAPGQEKNCDHAEEGAKLYELYVRNCRWVNNPDYCSSLEKFKNEYENIRSEDTKCINSMQYLTPVGHNPVANFLNATLAMSIITFVFIYFYNVCNKTILKKF